MDSYRNIQGNEHTAGIIFMDAAHTKKMMKILFDVEIFWGVSSLPRRQEGMKMYCDSII